MAKKNKKPQRGRPPEGREPMIAHVLPEVIQAIDSQIDRDNRKLCSRGRVIESKFSVN